MCKVLKINRSHIYYQRKEITQADKAVENSVIEKFHENRKAYDTRRLKVALELQEVRLSRRKIGKVMAKYGLVSRYTKASFKPQKTAVNNESCENVLDRDFNQKSKAIIVSDLTYVRVGLAWNYVCTIVDLRRREVVGYSCGPNKTADLVMKAFANMSRNIGKYDVFHTDRGSEFKNHEIDALLEAFHITRSLSKKGCPYDNAVAEATFKSMKMECLRDEFRNIEHLKLELADYVNWYNNIRLHSANGYKPPRAA